MQESDLLDNKYRIEQQLGEGGMGAVYRAVHLGTKRTVAVKIIHPQLSNYDEFIERFRREAEAAGRLRHPNVVDVTDFGFAQTSDGPVAYLVMEYLDGCTLAQVLEEEKRLPAQWVVDILEQVCSAVAEAHRIGIIHRDLKPDNIWLEPNRRGGHTVKVLDFGLVKLDDTTPRSLPLPSRPRVVDDSLNTLRLVQLEDQTLLKDTVEPMPSLSHGGAKVDSNGRLRRDVRITSDGTLQDAGRTGELTRLGSVMGTPAYMSPEQCHGGSIDARSDIYSLGVIAYRMLAGETPFKGDTNTLLTLHRDEPPLQVREKNRRIPRKLARLVMSALEKDPALRPQTAGGFGAALSASLESTSQLLRHAIALYSEHFPTFLKIALIGYTPLMLSLAAGLVTDALLAAEDMSPLMQSVRGLGTFAAIIVTNVVAYLAVSAATVPVVVQLMMTPMRTIRLGSVWSAIRRRWPALVVTSIVVLALILFGTIVFVIPGVVAAILFALYGPVVIMEDLGVWATLKRAARLARRSRASVLTITLLQFVLPVLVWRASIDTTFTLKLNDDYSPRQFGFSFSSSNRAALLQLLNIFVAPLTATMISLLYLKTRQAGGESLSDASERFERLDIPGSKWQTQMRRSSTAATKRN